VHSAFPEPKTAVAVVWAVLGLEFGLWLGELFGFVAANSSLQLWLHREKIRVVLQRERFLQNMF